MTKEELVTALRGATAQYGTYTVSGDRLTRELMAGIHRGPGEKQGPMLFRVEGDTLIVTPLKDGSPQKTGEGRYTRVK